MIRARERDPSLVEIDLGGLEAKSATALCDRIAATGVLEEVRADARGRVEAAKEALADAELDEQRRELLALVADGVVERYA